MTPSRGCWARRASSGRPSAPQTAWSSCPSGTRAGRSLGLISLLWRRRPKKRCKRQSSREQSECLPGTSTHGSWREKVSASENKEEWFFFFFWKKEEVWVRGIKDTPLGLDPWLPGSGQIMWQVLQILEDLPLVFTSQPSLKTFPFGGHWKSGCKRQPD